MKKLLESLQERTLLGDGAMGTELQAAGMRHGECGELWNLEHPEKVLAIQNAYVNAGSDCLITNTFRGSRILLECHGLGEKVKEINQAAVEIARQAFGKRPGYVLGDIGPFGAPMEPFGDLDPTSVRTAFTEQAKALVAAGVDAIIVETQTSLEELKIGLLASREAGAPCVIGSIAFEVTVDGSDVRTMTGVDPEGVAAFLQKAGADVAGLNCGIGIDMTWAARILERYRRSCDLPVMAQPNAGSPLLEGRRFVYPTSPERMAAGIPGLLEAGARIIGACCGSSPAHIRCFRQLINEWNSLGEQA